MMASTTTTDTLSMSWNSEFDKFLASQKADKAAHGNLSDRKAQWLGKIDTLYSLVNGLLEPYSSKGTLAISRSVADIREEPLGSYQVPSLKVDLGGSSVRFVPIGTMLLGSPGRIDLVGMHGIILFVLVLPESDRPLFSVSTSFDGRPGEHRRGPLDLTPYEWKISTLPPRIRYSAIDVSSLQSAIMEASNGHSRRR